MSFCLSHKNKSLKKNFFKRKKENETVEKRRCSCESNMVPSLPWLQSIRLARKKPAHSQTLAALLGPAVTTRGRRGSTAWEMRHSWRVRPREILDYNTNSTLPGHQTWVSQEHKWAWWAWAEPHTQGCMEQAQPGLSCESQVPAQWQHPPNTLHLLPQSTNHCQHGYPVVSQLQS